jgi:hypothetical protein
MSDNENDGASQDHAMLYGGQTQRSPQASVFRSRALTENTGASQAHANLYRGHGNSRPRLSPQDDANARTFGEFMVSLLFGRKNRR